MPETYDEPHAGRNTPIIIGDDGRLNTVLERILDGQTDMVTRMTKLEAHFEQLGNVLTTQNAQAVQIALLQNEIASIKKDDERRRSGGVNITNVTVLAIGVLIALIALFLKGK